MHVLNFGKLHQTGLFIFITFVRTADTVLRFELFSTQKNSKNVHSVTFYNDIITEILSSDMNF